MQVTYTPTNSGVCTKELSLVMTGEKMGKSTLWPFPSVNGQQTPQSKALQSDKGQHKPTPKDLTNIGDALL